MNTLALRLAPGCDLRQALAEQVRLRVPTGSAFVLSGIGSLGDARLRLAGADAATCLAGPVELLSLAGTVSPEGLHLHASVADAHGRVLGGHLMPGNVVRTTAELLLVWSPDWTLGRAPDAHTGFLELVVWGPTSPAG